MTLEIITPDAIVFTGEVTSVTVPGADGMFQVLNNHAPIISTLIAGKIKFQAADGEQVYDAEGGVVEVLKNKVIVLAERIKLLKEN
ncbi:MAG TPA: ATP synthase F1 subunit epsilon [Bacteroidetes bacterium]|nr:ATP synthase F1 subunit epsilon [Bacteroidota bacterium]